MWGSDLGCGLLKRNVKRAQCVLAVLESREFAGDVGLYAVQTFMRE